MFPERLISEGSSRIEADELHLALRLPWYRALPLSCVNRIDVALDGVAVPGAQVRITVNGREFAIEELAAEYDVWWYVLDDAPVRVVNAPLASSVAGPRVTVTVGLVIPYLPVDGQPLQIQETGTQLIQTSGVAA